MHPIERALRIASRQTERHPSDAQVKAGNYAKGKVRIKGLEIAIENPKGSTRSGIDKDGKRWHVTMPAAYGYFLGTVGRDKDHVDCYIGPEHDSDKVFVVDQVDAQTKRFDEHKCLLSFASKKDALAAYEKAFSDGKAKDRIGHVTEMGVADFKKWLHSGDTTKPLRGRYADGGAVDAALAVARKYAPAIAQNNQSPSDYLKDQFQNRQPSEPDFESLPPPNYDQWEKQKIDDYLKKNPGTTRWDARDRLYKSPDFQKQQQDILRKGSQHIPFDQIPSGTFVPHQ